MAEASPDLLSSIVTGLGGCQFAIIGTPVQWALIVLVALVLFAPRLIPVAAKILGRMVGLELRRRYGITIPAPNRPAIRNANKVPAQTPDAPALQDAAPAQPKKTEMFAELDQPIPDIEPERASVTRSLLPGALVLSGCAVLLWYLLHRR